MKTLEFKFSERDLVQIKQLENEGYIFTEVVMTDRNGKERFVKLVAFDSSPPKSEGNDNG